MPSNNNKPITGQCLCGSVTYSIDKLEPNMGNCHCNMCRKFHGSAFATYAQAKSENFHWLSGKYSIKNYIGKNGTVRKFCCECGSSLIFQNDINENHEIIHFAAGTLDSDIDIKPNVHIYMESQANWFSVEDDLPKHEAGRDSKHIV